MENQTQTNKTIPKTKTKTNRTDMGLFSGKPNRAEEKRTKPRFGKENGRGERFEGRICVETRRHYSERKIRRSHRQRHFPS